ncbi:MAG: ATP-binding protein, partial [Trebonia sp.]
PVPVVDVLRAAVAEVEDYVRVDVLSESRDLVAGTAVNDVIHLVAELVENAAAFSPPNTRIEVRADRAGTGLVAEIEDRGLGLSQPELTEINQRLANPPDFDLENSEQLGLFVVSRLAIRHAIKVSLRQSVYGGTTAILVLPFGVIVREEEAGSVPVPGGRPADGQPPEGQTGWAALPPGASGSDPGDQMSSFGATGRHRLLAAATGRRADPGPADHGDEQNWPPPRPLPRPPWENAQPEPPGGRPPWELPEPEPQRPSRSAPDAFVSAPRALGGERPGSERPGSERPGGERPAAPASSGSHLGMPIRVPQASLAPQLQAHREHVARNPEPDIDERSPEAIRNMMIKMQQGWERGRVDDLDDAPDHGTER